MNNKLFHGELVRLAAQDSDKDIPQLIAWSRDTEHIRLAFGQTARPWTTGRVKERMERAVEPDHFPFAIYTRTDDQLIGTIGLYLLIKDGDAWVYINIGNRDYWGKGYGTDAMRVILRYAFMELNLHRVTLGVFGYNLRAMRSYEKCGFVREGVMRGSLRREGGRWDEIWMGILKADWEKGRNDAPAGIDHE